MQPQFNIALRDFSTLHLGGPAAYVLAVANRPELQQALAWANEQSMPVIMIGAGSHILWRDEGFQGLVLVNKITRYEDFDEDGANHYITAGAGESWDSVVARSTAAGLTGLELLSGIPGTVGASPIQNIGAFEVEISQNIVSIEAYDSTVQTFITIPAADCAFRYRGSRFNTDDKGRFYITAVTLHVMEADPSPPFDPVIQQYLDGQRLTQVTPQALRDTVIALRSANVPDMSKVATAGSFFTNPIISTGAFGQLSAAYADIPHWVLADGKVKVSATWLIDQTGFQDVHDQETGVATWPADSSILINEHAASTNDLLKFKQKIVNAVYAKFTIRLEPQVEVLP